MKKLILSFILLIIPFLGQAQEAKKIDSVAVSLLDRMSDVIGELESCAYNLKTATDKLNADKNIVKYHGTSSVSMEGPDKLIVRAKGDRGDHGFWYNGEYLTYYSFSENTYVTLESSDNIIDMTNTMHDTYDFKFPAIDFFSPTFTDDILENFDTIQFLGMKTINGQDCFHVMITNENLNVQFWISNDIQTLPLQFAIIYKKENNRQFEGTFSNWQLNPDIPNRLFDFSPPPSAKLISILAKS